MDKKVVIYKKKQERKLVINKQANIGVQTIFYILMAFFMVWILVFGYQKLFIIQDYLSDSERLEITAKLQELYKYCDDPLNSKNVQYYKIKNKNFNGICLLGDDFMSSQYASYYGFSEVFDSGMNAVVINTNFRASVSGVFELVDYDIVDSFKLDVESISDTFCNFDLNNTGSINLKIQCQ